MKHNIISLRPVAFGVLTMLTSVWIAATQTAAGQNTAFTYQGRLTADGAPANGVYDLSFQAFDALTGGSSVGGTVSANGVGVTNGLFTALVDLGATPFTGPARWLQISVSTNGADSFTVLTPRQPLTPSPYSIYAHTAGTVTNGAIANAQLAANAVAAGNIQNSTITAGKIASGQVVKSLNGLTDAVSLTQGANVTINTVGNSLQISAPAGGLNLPFSGSASSTGSVFTLANSGAGPAGAFLGNVGIGTMEPRTRLTVWTPNVTGVQEGLRLNNPIGFGGTGNGSALVFSQDRDTSENFVNASIQGVQELVDSSANAYLAFSTKSAGGVAEKMRITGAGDVGVGTTRPQARLDVRGDVRLGPNGEFRAASGEENLVIVRGRVSASGSRLSGSGFSVNHTLFTSFYQIFFFVSFTDKPAVTATVEVGSSMEQKYATILNSSDNSVFVWLHDVSTGEVVENDFSFIAIGTR